ncbi:MAG: hypothetical protein AAF518_26085, partial [Spirochaetota bacterium]
MEDFIQNTFEEIKLTEADLPHVILILEGQGKTNFSKKEVSKSEFIVMPDEQKVMFVLKEGQTGQLYSDYVGYRVSIIKNENTSKQGDLEAKKEKEIRNLSEMQLAYKDKEDSISKYYRAEIAEKSDLSLEEKLVTLLQHLSQEKKLVLNVEADNHESEKIKKLNSDLAKFNTEYRIDIASNDKFDNQISKLKVEFNNDILQEVKKSYEKEAIFGKKLSYLSGV